MNILFSFLNKIFINLNYIITEVRVIMITCGKRADMPSGHTKKACGELARELTLLQLKVRELKIPVMILFEGWEAAGKGYLISRLINNFDPRGFRVHTITPAQTREHRKPYMCQFWNKLPEYGQIAIFDRSWYLEPSEDLADKERCPQEAAKTLEDINCFEAQLADDGYVLIKIFADISRQEQKKRLDELLAHEATSWRVSKEDYARHKLYDKYLDVYNTMISSTHSELLPWYIVDGQDKRVAKYQAFSIIKHVLTQAVEKKVDGLADPPSSFCRYMDTAFPLNNPAQTLAGDASSADTAEEEYRAELKKAQKQLLELHYELYKARIPAIILYEGWDAAGKGGNIKRLAHALDPRGYHVTPIAAPTPPELNRHYLWRFWQHIPNTGHIQIFDRTWYGRVLVERVEGFAKEAEWQRAYNEINFFEKSLSDWGALIFKFWINIDKEEQLKRFEQRQQDELKRWKITEEDWRNREKWDAYAQAAADMFRLTDTPYAPWVIVPSNNKRYARIMVLRHIISAIGQKLQKSE